MTTGLSLAQRRARGEARPRKPLDRLTDAGVFDLAVEAAAAHGLTVEELVQRCRKPPRPAARAAFCKTLKALGWSYPRLGVLLGMNPTSVLYLLEDASWRARKAACAAQRAAARAVGQ